MTSAGALAQTQPADPPKPVEGQVAATMNRQQDTRQRVRVVLKNDDILRGRLVSSDEQQVTIDHPHFGEITFQLENIKSWGPIQQRPATGAERESEAARAAVQSQTPQGPAQPPAKAGQKADVATTDAEAAPEEPVVEEDKPKWSGSLDAGANGATGNSESHSARIALALKRETELTRFNFTSTYTWAKSGGSVNVNRFVSRANYERDVKDSRVFYFADAQFIGDEDQDFKTRLDGNVGPGYIFIDDDVQKLDGRVGLGANYEFSGDDVGLNAQAIARMNWSRVINDQSRFSASTQYTQTFNYLDNWLLSATALYEVDMNEEGTWKLKTGVEYEYNNQPGDAKRADTRYFVTMGYSF